MSTRPLGAIMAGGASSRFGAPKALAELGGSRIIDRVAAALQRVTPDLVIIANDPVIAGAVPFESRPDVVVGVGALAGVLTALLRAREMERDRILAVACDMPFADPALLSMIDDRAQAQPDADVIAPASRGPRGLEPLCAAYRTSCIEPIRQSIDRDDRRMIGFHRDVRVETIPISVVSTIADPDHLFMNVNTRQDLDRAIDLLAGKQP